MNKKLLHRYIVLIFSILGVCLCSIANAQSFTPEKQLEDYLESVIAKYVTEGQFNIKVNIVKKKEATKKIPYMPQSSQGSLGYDHPRDIIKMVSSISIEVVSSSENLSLYRSGISEIIKTSLDLKPWPNAIKFTSIKSLPPVVKKNNLEQESSAKFNEALSTLTAKLMSTEAELRAEKKDKEELSKKNQEAVQKLTLIERDLEKLERKPALQPAPREENTDSDNSSTSQQSMNSPWILVSLGILGLLMLGFFIFKGASNAGKLLQIGLEKLATSVGAAGKSISQASPHSERVDSSKQDAMKSNSSSKHSRQSLAEIHDRIKSIHKELLLHMEQDEERVQKVVMNYVSEQLKSISNVENAVSALEVFGSDFANKMYHSLNYNYKNMIVNFLNMGGYSTSKAEVMLKTAETLITKITCADLTSPNVKLTPVVENKIMQLPNDAFHYLVKVLDEPLIARSFSYINPREIGIILSEIKIKNEALFFKAADALKKLHEVADDLSLDDQLVTIIAEWQQIQQSDKVGYYLPVYKKVIESMDEDASEHLILRLGDGNPTVKNYLNDNIISFLTFFNLYVDVQVEIIEKLELDEIISLIVLSSDEHRNIIRGLLDKTQLSIIDEEIQHINKSTQRKMENTYRSTRLKIKRMIEDLNQGSLAGLLEEKSQSSKNDNSFSSKEAA